MARISKLMITDVPTLKKEATISEAAKLTVDKPYGCVIIVERKSPIGIITESDLVRNLASKKLSSKEKVTKIMSSPITSISPNAKLEEASKIIDTKHFKSYPIVDNGDLVGLATENSIVQELNDNIRFHRNIQNIVLILFILFEFFVFVLYKYIIEFMPFFKVI